MELSKMAKEIDRTWNTERHEYRTAGLQKQNILAAGGPPGAGGYIVI